MKYLVSLAGVFILCFLTHEGGHYLAALCFGRRLRFRFAWGRFYVPRFVWDMPHMERWKQQVVAAAGFGMEFVVAMCLALSPAGFWLMYLCVWVHLCAYPFYAGTASDLRWFF